MKPPATLTGDAAPVNIAALVDAVALPVGVREGCTVMVELPEAEGAGIPLELALKPLHRPLLQVLKAHSSSLEQAALKLPHAAIKPALLAQH